MAKRRKWSPTVRPLATAVPPPAAPRWQGDREASTVRCRRLAPKLLLRPGKPAGGEQLHSEFRRPPPFFFVCPPAAGKRKKTIEEGLVALSRSPQREAPSDKPRASA